MLDGFRRPPVRVGKIGRAGAVGVPKAVGNGRQMGAQLVEQERRELQRPVDAGLGLLAEHELSRVEVEPSARALDQLADPRTGKAERGEEGAAAVALMLRQLALPSARRVEQVDHHVGLEERAARLRHLHAPAPAARGVRIEQPVLDGVVEDLGEQVEDHVHRPRREATADELLAKVVDAARVKLGGDVARPGGAATWSSRHL